MGLTCHFCSWKLFQSNNNTDHCYFSGKVLLYGKEKASHCNYSILFRKSHSKGGYFKIYAAFLFNIIIVILHTNIDNPLFSPNSDNTVVTMTQQEQKAWKNALDPIVRFHCSVQTRKAMRAHAQRNARMRHAHTDALAHTRTHTPFTLQLRWVLDDLVLTCCSDDLPREDVPRHSQRLPPSP